MSSPFAAFAPYVHIDKADRLELKTKAMPPDLLSRALTLESHCAQCKNPIHPFRFRREPERAAKSTGHVYVSLVCPIAVDIGCSRSHAADTAKAQFIREIRALQSIESRPPTGTEYKGEDDWFDRFPEGM